MKSIEIKRVSTAEITELQEIGRQTFVDTFSAFNKKADMDNYLDESFSFARLEAELTSANSAIYFATIGERIIGYIKVNTGPSQTMIKDDRGLQIERLYVLKEFQGKKAGRVLFNKAKEIARKKALDYIWLGVWEKNLKAIRFYEKNGFYEFDRYLFKLGNDNQTDILMKLELTTPFNYKKVVPGLIISLLIAFLFLKEWVKIGLIADPQIVDSYSFGISSAEENGWYYESGYIYALSAFIQGTVFTAITISFGIALVKNSKKALKISYFALLLAIIITLFL